MTERNIGGKIIVIDTLFLRNVQTISKVWKVIKVAQRNKCKRRGKKRIKNKTIVNHT